ncbi:MAG: CHAT domain-containing protein [Acidobacteriota bacterium]
MGQEPTADASKITDLELDSAIARKFAGKQNDSFQVQLSANQYVKILLEQRGVDVGARLFDIHGGQIANFDANMTTSGTETIEFVPSIAGVYKLSVLTRYPLLPGGEYQIKIVDLHAATASDLLRQDARTSFTNSLNRYNAGEYDNARKAIEKTVEIDNKEFGLESVETASSMTQLARVVDALGDYDEALTINTQVLKIREKVLPPNHPDIANTLNYIAVDNNHKENFQTAIDFHKRALAMRETVLGPDHPAVGISLLNLGVVYSNLGDRLKSIDFYERALAIQEKSIGLENSNGATMLNNLGQGYDYLDQFDKAKPYLVRSVAIVEKLYGPDNPRVADALTNLAYCAVGQKDLQKAESIYLRILAIREKTVGPDHVVTAHVLYNLGNLYTINHDFAKAEKMYRQALLIREDKIGPESPGVGEVLGALALMLAEKGDPDQALQVQAKANDIDERNISLNLNIGSERQKLAYLSNLVDRTSQSVLLQNRFAPEDHMAIDLAATSVLRQKGRVLDAVSNSFLELRRRSNPGDQELLDNLGKLTQKISELILNGPEDISLQDHQAKIKDLMTEREKLEDEISRRAAGFYQRSNPVTLDSVKAAIPTDAALIEFAVYDPTVADSSKNGDVDEPRYTVYVIRDHGEVTSKDLGGVKPIDDAIAALRESLRDPENKNFLSRAKAVYEKIFKPIKALIGDAKHLLISPDGELNLIPFETLSDEKGQFLLEAYSIGYLTSGRDLLRMSNLPPSQSGPLVVANPEFGAPREKPVAIRSRRQSINVTRNLSDTYFAPLAGSDAEAKTIKKLFPSAVYLTGRQASESALKRAHSPNILHIATHGFFLLNGPISQKNPLGSTTPTATKNLLDNPLLRSGLALAGANQHNSSADDGILTAFEASGLNLWGTRLVVLSACDTGLGEVRNGEGVYGLRRSFLLAGAESLVMSLWPVSDNVTRELMTSYYTNLKHGMGRGEALRQVQLEMMKRPERRHPFYWASFIQAGEWADLDGKR